MIGFELCDPCDVGEVEYSGPDLECRKCLSNFVTFHKNNINIPSNWR